MDKKILKDKSICEILFEIDKLEEINATYEKKWSWTGIYHKHFIQSCIDIRNEVLEDKFRLSSLSEIEWLNMTKKQIIFWGFDIEKYKGDYED